MDRKLKFVLMRSAFYRGVAENTHDLQEVKGISNSSSQFPGRVYYVAQLRNEAYIRETTPKSYACNIFVEVYLAKFRYSRDFFLGFSKL